MGYMVNALGGGGGGGWAISDEQTCLITTSYHVPKLRYSIQARKYKPLLHCTESFKRKDIKTFCLWMANEHNY